MSTLEKAIGMLEVLPESKVEAVCAFIRLLDSQEFQNLTKPEPVNKDAIHDMYGIAHEYTDTTQIEKRQKGFQGLMSFAGTLPNDFDYKKELDEAREEKYARFI